MRNLFFYLTYLYNMEYGIADMHNDILTATDCPDLAALAAETEACVCAIYTGERKFAQVRRLARSFFAERRSGQYLSLEDASYLDGENIEEVCGWRPVCVSLTWNKENALAGGCMAEGGLTQMGEQVLRILASRGIALDCAHLNVRSFYDALDIAPRIACSHACLYARHPHPRNLKDSQIREVIQRGGIVGIALVKAFLGGQGDAEAVFRHFDHGVQKFGIGGFCFGTDFNGTDDLPLGLERYACLETLADRFLRAGYTKKDVRRLYFENLLEYLSANDCIYEK